MTRTGSRRSLSAPDVERLLGLGLERVGDHDHAFRADDLHVGAVRGGEAAVELGDGAAREPHRAPEGHVDAGLAEPPPARRFDGLLAEGGAGDS